MAKDTVACARSTNVEEERCCLRYVMRNVGSPERVTYPHKPGEAFDSPTLYDTWKGTWWMQIYLGGQDENDDKVSFFLCRADEEERIGVGVQLHLANTDPTHGLSTGYPSDPFNWPDTANGKPASRFGLKLPLSKQELLSPSRGFFMNDDEGGSKLVFEATLFRRTMTTDHVTRTMLTQNRHAQPPLRNDLGHLLKERHAVARPPIYPNDNILCRQNGLHTDITFRVTGTDEDTKTFRVHKAIVAARSPVFSAMFTTETVETTTGTVTVNDIDPVAFEQVAVG